MTESVIDRENITRFFRDRNIDEYAIISASSSLHALQGRRPCDLLPSASTLILFAVEMDEDLFLRGKSLPSTGFFRNLLQFPS
jgi:hypothetical protein